MTSGEEGAVDRVDNRSIERATVTGWRGIILTRILPHMKLLSLFGIVLIIVGAATYLVLAQPDPQTFANWGYAGIAALMLLCSATILLPAPGFAAVVAAGGIWNPLLVGLSAGVGAALGEFSSYLLGLSSENLLGFQSNPRWQAISGLMRKYGFWAIVLGAATPLPFDILGLIAGSTGYPASRFLAASLLGKTIKYLILAYFGDAALAVWLGGETS